MKYGKLINNNLEILKQPIHTDNGDLFTNDESVLRNFGYKKIVYTEPSEAEGFYPEAHWEETEIEIVQAWELVPIPDEIDYETAYNELTEVFDDDTE